MLIGKCPKCGATYRGWALQSPWHQICDRCGTDIDIQDDITNTFTAHSTYKAEEQRIEKLWELPFSNAGEGNDN